MNPRFLLPVLLLHASPALAQDQSTLIVRSDADCTLTVNGQLEGALAADSAKAVKVGPGEQLIECASAAGVSTQQVTELEPGAQKVVRLELARRLRFPGNGATVRDSQTGLIWLAADNGYAINWNDARSWCAGRSPGSWSLPSMDELSTLAGAAHGSGAFKLTAGYFWSNETLPSSAAWFMDLRDGKRWSYISDLDFLRALCVRRSS